MAEKKDVLNTTFDEKKPAKEQLSAFRDKLKASDVDWKEVLGEVQERQTTVEKLEARIGFERDVIRELVKVVDKGMNRIREAAGIVEVKPETTGSTKTGTRKGKRGATPQIISFLKNRKDPQQAEVIAEHLGKSKKLASVRQTLGNLVREGDLVSLKKDGDEYRNPGKGERGGFYGLPS